MPLCGACAGDDTLKAKLLKAAPNSQQPLAQLVMHKLSTVYAAALASADGRVQDNDSGEGQEGEEESEGQEGEAAGDDVSHRAGRDQEGGVPDPLMELERVESDSELKRDADVTGAAASNRAARDITYGNEGVRIMGSTGTPGQSPRDAGMRSTSFADLPTPFAYQPAAAAITLPSDDGGPLLVATDRRSLRSQGGMSSAHGRHSSSGGSSSVSSSSTTTADVHPKMVMWSMDAAATADVVNNPAAQPDVTPERSVEVAPKPRYAAPAEVATLLRCGLGLLACLLSCLASKPDAAKPLVAQGSQLGPFLEETLKPLMTVLPEFRDPLVKSEKEQKAARQCAAAAQVNPAGRLCSPELRHWALVTLTNLCTSPLTAPLASSNGLLALAADSVRHGLGLDEQSKMKAGGLVRRTGGVLPAGEEFVVPAARALAAYLRTSLSGGGAVATAATSATVCEGAAEANGGCTVSAADVLQLTAEALTLVLEPRLATAPAAPVLPGTTRDVAFTGEPALQPAKAGPTWPAQELQVVQALAAALTYAAHGVQGGAQAHLAASAASAHLSGMLKQLLPHVWSWGDEDVLRACPAGSPAAVQVAACNAGVCAVAALVSCGHIAPEPVCASLMPVVASAVATPKRAVAGHLLTLLHDMCRVPACASMVVRDSAVMAALVGMCRRVQNASKPECAGSSMEELQALFLKLRPHDRYRALRTVVLPKSKSGADEQQLGGGCGACDVPVAAASRGGSDGAALVVGVAEQRTQVEAGAEKDSIG